MSNRLRVREMNAPRYSCVIGAPLRCIPVTNSERSGLGCPNKYRYQSIEHLKKGSSKLTFGTAFHGCVDRYHKWQISGADTEFDIAKVCREAINESLNESSGMIDMPDFDERLFRLFEFWYSRWHEKWKVMDSYEVVASELQVAVPVLDSNGKNYCPVTHLTEIRNGKELLYKITGLGEKADYKVRWPYYQFFTVDALYRCRSSGMVYIYEAKTAANPKTRVLTASIDPQLAGYCYGIQSAIDSGTLDHILPDRPRVAGFVFDASANDKMSEVKLNKNGSVSKSVKPNSYMVKKYIEEHKDDEGFDSEAMNEFLLEAELNHDSKWFNRLWGTYDQEGGKRFQIELYGSCMRISNLRSLAVKCKTSEDVYASFPRTMVCMGSFCAFKTICLQDDEFSKFQIFNQGQGVTWRSNNTTEEGVQW